MKRRTFLWGAVSVPLALVVPTLPFPEIRTVPAGQKYPRREGTLPNIVLHTHEGRAVRFYDDLIKDKIVIINMIYTDCPAVCPLTTANLVKVQKALGDRLGRDIFMYSITLDPEQDTPVALKEYAQSHGVGPGWSFLTGKKEEITSLRRKLGFYHRDPERDELKETHTGMIRIGNDALHRWTTGYALSKPSRIVQTIHRIDLHPESRGAP